MFSLFMVQSVAVKIGDCSSTWTGVLPFQSGRTHEFGMTAVGSSVTLPAETTSGTITTGILVVVFCSAYGLEPIERTV